MAVFKDEGGNSRPRAAVYRRIRTGISAFQSLPVRNPMVPANNLLYEDARGTIAFAGVVHGNDLPESVGKSMKLASLRHGVLNINFVYGRMISNSP